MLEANEYDIPQEDFSLSRYLAGGIDRRDTYYDCDGGDDV